MSGYRTRDYEQDGYEYHPFEQWFWIVAHFVQDYPLKALAYVFYELDESVELEQSNVDNLFVSDYNKDSGDFKIEIPDD